MLFRLWASPSLMLFKFLEAVFSMGSNFTAIACLSSSLLKKEQKFLHLLVAVCRRCVFNQFLLHLRFMTLFCGLVGALCLRILTCSVGSLFLVKSVFLLFGFSKWPYLQACENGLFLIFRYPNLQSLIVFTGKRFV